MGLEFLLRLIYNNKEGFEAWAYYLKQPLGPQYAAFIKLGWLALMAAHMVGKSWLLQVRGAAVLTSCLDEAATLNHNSVRSMCHLMCFLPGRSLFLSFFFNSTHTHSINAAHLTRAVITDLMQSSSWDCQCGFSLFSCLFQVTICSLANKTPIHVTRNLQIRAWTSQ